MFKQDTPDILSLVRDLFPYATGAVSPANEPFFARLQQELSFTMYRYPSGSEFNGWVVPQRWHVIKATIHKNGKLLFDGTKHPLAVAVYSKSFHGVLDVEELKSHLVTNPKLPEAYLYHCRWQYRPSEADWALCVPYTVYRTFGRGRYRVELVTAYEPGEMLVAEYEHRGRSDRTIVLNAHTCHPQQANDDTAGVAVLVRLFQWLAGQETYYTYRLVLGPEHLGTVFYLRDQTPEQLKRLVGGAFAEMPGTQGPIKVASSFLGDQPIDKAFRQAARHDATASVAVPWRQGAGNDETVWEAPGYEVPFVEVSRAEQLCLPYPEYHSSFDIPALLDREKLEEFYHVFQQAVMFLEQNARLYRRFNGLICLSSPQYKLYLERPDPAVEKHLAEDSEKWGHLLDCLFRYLDGSMTILDIAEKHDLPFAQLYRYLVKFQEAGLVDFQTASIDRLPISRMREPNALAMGAAVSGNPEETALR